LGKANNGTEAFSEPLYAWKINIQEEAILPIETEDVKCDFDISYPKP